MKKILTFALAFACLTAVAKPKDYTVTSPQGGTKVVITVNNSVSWSLYQGEELLIGPSKIGIELAGGESLESKGAKVLNLKRSKSLQMLEAPVYKTSAVLENYAAIMLSFKYFNLEVRAFEEGAAYRIVPKSKAPFQVKGETANFVFPDNTKAWIPYVNNSDVSNQFSSSFENQYSVHNLNAWQKGRLAFLPVLAESKGYKILITESGLTNYPGMYLKGNGTTLEGVFAPYPKTRVQGGHNMLEMPVTEREGYIAKFDKAEPLPWRIAVVAKDDAALLETNLPWLLAEPSTGDYSWVKPGKVAWDWWNDWNIWNVPFRAGINNDTYKYYIDFASAKGIEYVILDEGWAVNLKADLFQVVPEINLKELVEYASKRGVGLILWAGYHAFDRDMEKACKVYSEMGVKGFKVDFMNADDQMMVDFYTRAAAMCAKYGLLIDFHGAFKPAGLQRTYPNVINYEGVYGLENMKWAASDVDQVTYDVTIPFIRNVAGPMDYTQGAMRNATKSQYRPDYSSPMSQGTRCRQLAEYAVFFAPLTMLCDSPSAYLAEPECTEFIAGFPTVWDETVALAGKVGEYVAVARRSGDVWYVGALTNWDARTLELDLSFLGEGSWKAEIFADGPNAGKAAHDYVHCTAPVPGSRTLSAPMAPGGGWVARISR